MGIELIHELNNSSDGAKLCRFKTTQIMRLNEFLATLNVKLDVDHWKEPSACVNQLLIFDQNRSMVLDKIFKVKDKDIRSELYDTWRLLYLAMQQVVQKGGSITIQSV